MQLLNKSLVAAMMFGASVAMAYEDVTDNTGATEPPKGQADNSFVEGVYPPGSEKDKQAQREAREAERDRSVADREDRTYQGSDVSDSDSRESRSDSRDSDMQVRNEQLFDQLDEDRDGNVSKYEVQNYNELVQSFDEVDRDNDGVLSEDELQNWQGFERIEEDR